MPVDIAQSLLYAFVGMEVGERRADARFGTRRSALSERRRAFARQLLASSLPECAADVSLLPKYRSITRR